MQRITEKGGKLYLSQPARHLGPYWVRVKGETQDTIAFYVEYDATDEVEEGAAYLGVANYLAAKDPELPVWSHAWCLDQDPENEARCFDDSDFERIGKRIPANEQLDFLKTLRRNAVEYCTGKMPFEKFKRLILGPESEAYRKGTAQGLSAGQARRKKRRSK